MLEIFTSVRFSQSPSHPSFSCIPFFNDQVDLHFMKKIPPGAEASNILVGELEFLDRAVVAFVRLSPAMLLSGLAEVPIPSR